MKAQGFHDVTEWRHKKGQETRLQIILSVLV